jgi:hypothetical protein
VIGWVGGWTGRMVMRSQRCAAGARGQRAWGNHSVTGAGGMAAVCMMSSLGGWEAHVAYVKQP